MISLYAGQKLQVRLDRDEKLSCYKVLNFDYTGMSLKNAGHYFGVISGYFSALKAEGNLLFIHFSPIFSPGSQDFIYLFIFKIERKKHSIFTNFLENWNMIDQNHGHS